MALKVTLDWRRSQGRRLILHLVLSLFGLRAYATGRGPGNRPLLLLGQAGRDQKTVVAPLATIQIMFTITMMMMN